MDAISLILSALAAGASAAIQETAGTAIKDTYQGLVSLIKNKFGKNPTAEAALAGYAEDPDTWKKPLEKSLQETGVAEDKGILHLAQKMLELVPSSKSGSTYNVKIEGGAQGFVQGDHATVTMNFNEPEPEKKRKR